MAEVTYRGEHNRCSWAGHRLSEADIDEIKEDVRERALDLAHSTALEDQMRDLAQTGAASQWIEAFLGDAQSPDVLDWQVGEALAEAILRADFAVVFPWNTRRDERTPKASLPGADIVGISNARGVPALVFGEVKSSTDTACPPGVLVGKSGMVEQLERILADRSVQLTLIQWLSARVPDGPLGELFDEALGRFVNTAGAGVRMIGALMRDTEPSEADVSSRGRSLGDRAAEPGTVELLVFYLPMKMATWPKLVAV